MLSHAPTFSSHSLLKSSDTDEPMLPDDNLSYDVCCTSWLASTWLHRTLACVQLTPAHPCSPLARPLWEWMHVLPRGRSATERNQKQVLRQQQDVTRYTLTLTPTCVLSDTGCLAPVWWRSTRKSLILQKDQMIWMMTLVGITSICVRVLRESRVTCLIPCLCSPADYPPGYTPEVKLSKNLIGSAKGGFVVPESLI